jgi:hypothetical protein
MIERPHRDRKVRPWVGHVEQVGSATDDAMERRRQPQKQWRRLDDEHVGLSHDRYRGGRDDRQASLVDHAIGEATVRSRHHRQAKNIDPIDRLTSKANRPVASPDASVRVLWWTGHHPNVVAQVLEFKRRLAHAGLGRSQLRRK